MLLTFVVVYANILLSITEVVGRTLTSQIITVHVVLYFRIHLTFYGRHYKEEFIVAKSDAYYLKQGVKAMPFVDNVSATLTEGIDSKTHSEEIMNNFRGYLSEEIRKDCSVAVAFRTALVRITSEITESTTAGIELFNKSLYASGI